MKHISQLANLSLRLATIDDMIAIFTLANDESVRANSFHSEKIELENHKKWFAKKIQDPNSVLLIAELNNEFAGQLRFDLDGDSALVGISLCPEMRGKGLASKLLDEGIKYLSKHFRQIRYIKAYIKPSNIPSIKLFERTGFEFVEKTRENDCEALLYVYTHKENE